MCDYGSKHHRYLETVKEFRDKLGHMCKTQGRLCTLAISCFISIIVYLDSTLEVYCNNIHIVFEIELSTTLCEAISSMSLIIVEVAFIILGSFKTQSKISFVAILPIPTKEMIVKKVTSEVTSATLKYSSTLGIHSSWNHLASLW